MVGFAIILIIVIFPRFLIYEMRIRYIGIIRSRFMGDRVTLGAWTLLLFLAMTIVAFL
jgi:hypothetical protein